MPKIGAVSIFSWSTGRILNDGATFYRYQGIKLCIKEMIFPCMRFKKNRTSISYIMKFRMLFLLLFAGTLGVQAQSGSSIDAVIGVSLPYSSFPGFDSDVFRQLPGWRIGGNYHHTLGQRFGLRIGTRIWVENAKIDLSELRFGSQHNGEGGFDPSLPSNENLLDRKINNLWIEVPLAGRWYLGKGSWRGFVELGVAPTIFLTQRNVRMDDNGYRESFWIDASSADTEDIQIIGLAGGGVDFQALERVAFYVTALGRYITNPIWNADLENFHNGNVGLEMGARFSIN